MKKEDDEDRVVSIHLSMLEDGSPLVTDLIREFERARRQWDEFQKTGVSTAAIGSYDLCITPILKKHLTRSDGSRNRWEACPGTREEAPNVTGSPLLEWAVSKWNEEVKHRPLVNVHRRSLDDTWRQVIRWAGGDPVALVGPPHDQLLRENPIRPQANLTGDFLKPSTTTRGFGLLTFTDHNGTECTLQESSLATEAAIWLGAAKLKVRRMPGDGSGWHDVDLDAMLGTFVGNERMHLTQNHVRSLLPALQHFAETGELPTTPRPEGKADV
jgi:hypothetical protein